MVLGVRTETRSAFTTIMCFIYIVERYESVSQGLVVSKINVLEVCGSCSLWSLWSMDPVNYIFGFDTEYNLPECVMFKWGFLMRFEVDDVSVYVANQVGKI